MHHTHIVAINMNRRHAVRTAKLGEWPRRLAVAQSGVYRVKIVFAHEDRRQLSQRGKIRTLVIGAFFQRGVTKIDYGDVAAAGLLKSERRTNPDRDRGGDDWQAEQHARVAVEQMHRAAAAAAASRRLTHQFA